MNNRITLILNYIILVFSIAINPSYWGKNIKNKNKKKRAKSLKKYPKLGSRIRAGLASSAVYMYNGTDRYLVVVDIVCLVV